MHRPLLFNATRMWSSVALMAVAGATAAVLAQEPATREHDHGAAAPVAAKGCAMMAQHQDMTAAMAAGDQKLTALLARMNAAKGATQVEAIAAVVSEIAAQRAQMTKMQGAMMDQMLSHMSAMHGHPQERREP